MHILYECMINQSSLKLVRTFKRESMISLLIDADQMENDKTRNIFMNKNCVCKSTRRHVVAKILDIGIGDEKGR